MDDDPLEYMGGRVLGDAFDGLDQGSESLELDLDPDLDQGAIRPTAVKSSRLSPSRMSAPSRMSRPSLAPDEKLPVQDLFEVTALADYGDTPSGWIGAVPYAVQVFTRRRALQNALVGIERVRAAASDDAQEAFVVLGRALHAQREAPELASFSRALAEADRTGQVSGQFTEEWQKSRSTAGGHRAGVLEEVKRAEATAAPLHANEAALIDEVRTANAELTRLRAHFQRAKIELRNVPPGTDRTPFEAERTMRRAELDRVVTNAKEVAKKLNEVRAALARHDSAALGLQKRLKVVDRAQRQTESVHLRSASEAEAEYHAAVVQLAERALSREDLAAQLAPREAKTALSMSKTLAARDKAIRVHEAAIEAYDQEAVKRGTIVVGLVALLALVTLLFVIFR